MRLFKLIILALLFISMLYSEQNYPKPMKKKYVLKINDKEIYDSFNWMKNKTNPKVIQFINQENKYTNNVLESLKSLQDSIYSETISHIQENDLSYPVKRGDYYYYFKSVKGKQHAIYYRKYKSLTSIPEKIFDPNLESEKYKFYDIGFYRISPNQNKLAFTVDTKGNERYTLYIKDLKSGEITEKAKAVEDFVWLNDNQSFYYTTVNQQFRSDKLFLFRKEKSKLIFTENDDRFVLWIYKSSDKKFGGFEGI